MTDIVNRLRTWSAMSIAQSGSNTLKEAADEIELLRDGIRMMRDDELLEIKRLRAALKIVATAELYDPATGIINADVLEVAQQAARAALGEPKP